MNYCSECIIPVTRPEQGFDDSNICNACKAYNNRKNIDRKKRWEIFLKKIEHAKQIKNQLAKNNILVRDMYI